MNTKLLLIYHGNCDDGFGAAWACHQAELRGRLATFWPQGVEYFKGVYGLPAPDCAGRDVVLADFCYPVEVMEKIIAEAKSVLVLDHHISAQKMMVEHAQGRAAARWTVAEQVGLEGQPVVEIKFDNGSMVFDMKRSGAAMAWDYFIGTALYLGKAWRPKLIQYIQDRDLWTKELPSIDEFTMALRSYPMDFEVWDKIYDDLETGNGGTTQISGFDSFVTMGAAILRYQNQLVDQAVKASFWVWLQLPVPQPDNPESRGQKVRIRGANCIPALASEVGEALAQKFGGSGLTWIDGKHDIMYSLRSRGENAPDVSELAKKFGGGGHAKAAGFKSKTPVHIKEEA